MVNVLGPKGLRLFAESLDSAHGYYSCKSRPKSAAGRDGLCIDGIRRKSCFNSSINLDVNLNLEG